jgi:hypothetical protein
MPKLAAAKTNTCPKLTEKTMVLAYILTMIQMMTLEHASIDVTSMRSARRMNSSMQQLTSENSMV